jgi:regulatory protein
VTAARRRAPRGDRRSTGRDAPAGPPGRREPPGTRRSAEGDHGASEPEAAREPGTRRDRSPPAELDAAGARRAAFQLLARKSWSRRELARRLERRGASADLAEAIVADLGARGYLDDDGFARWWAQARARGRRIGSVRLRRELLARGIAPDLAAAAVGAAFEPVSELDLAMAAGRRRLAGLARANPGRLPARLADHLLRRGYPASLVRQVVKALLASDLDDG